MEYYNLRKSGTDIDFIADEKDVLALIKMYPDRVKDLYADLGVCPFEFEIWRSINYFTYNDMKTNAIEENDFLVISLEKLLIMKSFVIKEEKYRMDMELVAQHIIDTQSKNLTYRKKI